MENIENTPVVPPTLSSVLSKTVSPTVWVEFKEGISFHLRFVPKAKFRSIADKATEMVYDPKQKQRLPKLNSEVFSRDFIKAAVLDWKGVTLRSLSAIAPIAIEGLTAEQLDASIPYDQAELTKLFDVVYDLDGFISDAVMDIKTFRPNLEEETKN